MQPRSLSPRRARLSPLGAALLVVALLAPAARAATDVPDPVREIERLFRGGEVSLAFQRLDEALAGQQGHVRLRFLRGVMLSETGREADAAAEFERLTQDHPDLPEPYNNLAVLEAAAGRLDQARALLEAALRNDPGYVAALENLGDVYSRLALRALEQASRLAPSSTTLPRKLQLARQLVQR